MVKRRPSLCGRTISAGNSGGDRFIIPVDWKTGISNSVTVPNERTWLVGIAAGSVGGELVCIEERIHVVESGADDAAIG